MMAAMTRSGYVETLQLSVGQRTVRVSLMSSWLDFRWQTFHANGPATEKLRGPKSAVLVCGTTRSP